jgi:conjugal transfer pilus assembly protein TraK
MLAVFAAVLGLTSMGAAAVQKVSVEDGGSYTVKISATELTRISVLRGRIDKAWANTGSWKLEADKTSGEVFIRPSGGLRKTFGFFVRDSFGNTFTLVAQPLDIPAETIQLDPMSRKAGNKVELGEQPYLSGIKSLLKDMANENRDTYFCREVGDEVPLWNETKIHLVAQCDNGFLSGDEYVINNVSGKELVLSEREFAQFGKDVRAVALEHLVLQANESTRLYIVRGAQQ